VGASQNLTAFLKDPLLGKTSLSRVVWLYGIVGSLLYGAIELFLDPENAVLMRLYTIGGVILTVYVIVATYRCAGNCKSPALARIARVSAVISLLLVPVFVYLELTGSLTLSSLGVEP
jgi:hypothetical protein